jgi:hypothetical protein
MIVQKRAGAPKNLARRLESLRVASHANVLRQPVEGKGIHVNTFRALHRFATPADPKQPSAGIVPPML